MSPSTCCTGLFYVVNPFGFLSVHPSCIFHVMNVCFVGTSIYLCCNAFGFCRLDQNLFYEVHSSMQQMMICKFELWKWEKFLLFFLAFSIPLFSECTHIILLFLLGPQNLIVFKNVLLSYFIHRRIVM